ncbi:hypothetical protein BZA05DRAFT_381334 [Tricharina praecox]|uniref:uncharacterized protein n=1 Tax=Tricharina praecox TaxID=43433 RepID=UPI00221F2BBB|nr:uncharacterized protein BZA05DRAFT_381334 [Tricharina praecox]KAI5858473.1 hypothetical protein BZA05DRAFT_381334 [Tricharina praecox]
MATASPLTQDVRPSFQPKIVSLYSGLFKDEDETEKTEGFWTEFFLLRPHAPGLVAEIAPLSPDDLLHLQPVTRQLFEKSVATFKAGRSPQDEIALDTLQIFLREVLKKRFTNFSSDVISLLTGLSNVDAVFTDFVAALETHIRNGKSVSIRRKAIQVALGIACGAFQTGLLSYFTHRDLFPALMKFINDVDTAGLTYEPFLLLGILANYNKFEFQNPYQLRLDDFVNEATIKRVIHEIGMTCILCRADYVAIQDDLPEGWSLNSMLSYVGLTILAGAGPKPKTPPPSAANGDISKLNFAELPNARAAILLATYDFVNANKLFCFNFVNYQEADPTVEPPICAYFSLTSYLLHHAHRSSRSSLYARLNLLVLRIFLEDQALCKRLVSDDTKGFVRLCRQKPPHLPIVRGKRILLTAVLDMVADGINHNLRKKMDVDLYVALVDALVRSVSFLIRTRYRLAYHWSELWRCLLTLMRFMASYATDLKDLPNISTLLDMVVNLVALSLSSGDSFLPGASEYDDLFYKLVEAGDVLVKFRDAYDLSKRPSNSIATLIKVSEHYYQLIEQKSGRGKNLTPQQVAEVIKSGYDSLAMDGGSEKSLDRWEKYREADERGFLKKVARMVVEDLRSIEVGDEPVVAGVR